MMEQTVSHSPIQDICIKCKSETAQLISRSEKMCISCFLKFIRFKVRRQMDLFKVNYDKNAPEQHILIGFSFGKGSLVLLDMLHDLLELQKERNNGKKGFHLHALFIDDKSSFDLESKIAQLKLKYPECHFEKSIDYENLNFEQEIVINNEKSLETKGIIDTLTHLKSRSAKQEFDTISKRRILDWYAMVHRYQTIAFGLSLTKLSELVISLAAKGRGDAVSDFVSPPATRTPRVIYPIGDLMNSELDLYINIMKLDHFRVNEATPPITTKLQSIDELVRQYFESVESGFPAIVSTVMKTAEKIGPKHEKEEKLCRLCNGRTQAQSKEWLATITVDCQTATSDGLCYGCTVLVQNTGIGKITVPRYDKCDILKEYSLE